MMRKKLIELLNEKNFDELDEIISSNSQNEPYVEFINAYIHEIKEYKEYSLLEARQLYEACIGRNNSISQSYYYYALHLLRNRNNADSKKALNILKRGFQKFPDSDDLLYLLLNKLRSENLSSFVMEFVDFNKLNSTNEILPFLALKCIKNKDLEFANWLVNLDVVRNYRKDHKYDSIILIGYLFYLSEDRYQAKVFFTHLVSYASGLVKDYAQLGLVLLLDDKDLEAAIEALPMTYSFEPLTIQIAREKHNVYFVNYLQILFDDVLNCGVVKENKRLAAKIKGIRGYLKFDSGDNVGISDLKSAIKHFKSKDYFKALHMMYYNKNNYKDTFKFGIEYFYYAPIEERAKGYCTFVIPENRSELLDLVKIVKLSEGRFCKSKKEFVQFVVTPVIKGLYKIKECDLVCELAEDFDFDYVAREAGFEVAYSYGKCGNDELSKKYYEYLENDSELVSVASLHNLANIYSNENNFERAVELREKALKKSGGDKDYEKSLLKEKERHTNYIKMMKDELEAVKSLDDENCWVLRILTGFYEHAENGFIECSYRLLPKYLRLEKLKAEDMIHQFIEKKYVQKVGKDEHRINTQSTVYKVNDEVYKALLQINSKEKAFNDLAIRLNDFTPNKIDELGYGDALISKVQSINDDGIREMICRDMSENIIAIITKSYKSSLVITGSIVEALIMHKLKANSIEKYEFSYGKAKEKTVAVKNMSLSQLITVAEENKLFTHEALKHSDAIRGYRNLIHPGVEVRKSIDTPVVTEDNVLLAWMVLKKVIFEM